MAGHSLSTWSIGDGDEPDLAFLRALISSSSRISLQWRGCWGSGAGGIHGGRMKVCCCAEFSVLKKECASSAEQLGWISLESADSSKSFLENFQKFLVYSFWMALTFFLPLLRLTSVNLLCNMMHW